mmetsp:Transcript_32659/g.31868  ORF Transcript_32659/g.31868 Transcript_32659/m.31868 type:complete len:81 (-) Transcript_32659:432-674(-)
MLRITIFNVVVLITIVRKSILHIIVMILLALLDLFIYHKDLLRPWPFHRLMNRMLDCICSIGVPSMDYDAGLLDDFLIHQ